MSYLVPPARLSDGQRQAVRDVASMMEVADEQREDAELQRQANAEEDAQAQWDPASATESPSTQRILDAYNELREQRQRGADEDEGDFYMRDVDTEESLLADLPGATTPDERARADATRTAKAIESVGKRMRSGVVKYADGTEEPAIPLDDHAAYVRECLSDFPTDAEPIRQEAAPRPAPAEESDDGYGPEDRGEYAGPRLASSPPIWVPPDQR